MGNAQHQGDCCIYSHFAGVTSHTDSTEPMSAYRLQAAKDAELSCALQPIPAFTVMKCEGKIPFRHGAAQCCCGYVLEVPVNPVGICP